MKLSYFYICCEKVNFTITDSVIINKKIILFKIFYIEDAAYCKFNNSMAYTRMYGNLNNHVTELGHLCMGNMQSLTTNDCLRASDNTTQQHVYSDV